MLINPLTPLVHWQTHPFLLMVCNSTQKKLNVSIHTRNYEKNLNFYIESYICEEETKYKNKIKNKKIIISIYEK